MTHHQTAAAVALAAGLLVVAQPGASARIVCEGNFQVVNGMHISTPYCRDATLAHVARAFGFRVSEEAIRHDEGVKAQVCRTIGSDIRVQDVCAPYRPDGGDDRQ